MPQVMNPSSQSSSPVVLAVTADYLRHYAAKLLGSEAVITAPTLGYKAYDKRVDLAQRVLQDVKPFVHTAANLFAKLDADLEQNAAGANQSLFVYLAQNQSFEAADADASLVSGWNNVGTTSGKSIWDALASVSLADLV